MKKIHLICNAHIDPVWQWEWEEGAAAAISTFRSAAEFCREYDGFIFNHNEALLYQWVEEYEPALFKEIQELVRLGKWQIIGGWYLQPDCNMPSGESFTRQILAGKKYFKDKFNVEPTTAVNFDSFGHTRGLVQILKKSGYDSYLFMRPDEMDFGFEEEDFIWKGYNNCQVFAHKINNGYNSLMGQAASKIKKWMEDNKDNALSMVTWGVGNHGGGPSRIDLKGIGELIKNEKDFEMLHSTPEKYFSDLKLSDADLPVFERSLTPRFVGCYTSQIRIKQKHRLLENELYMVEKMVSALSIQGLMTYPYSELQEALKDLLVSEFHDILPGSSVQPVEETSIRQLDHGLEIVSRLKARAFFALARGQKKAGEGEIPVLIYNPHPYKVKGIFECEFMLADQNWKEEFSLPVVFHNGNEIHSQPEKEHSNLNLDWRKRIIFSAELEPCTMNRFDCRIIIIPEKPTPKMKAVNGRFMFANDDMEISVNCASGLIDSYKINGIEYLTGSAFAPIVIKDNEDPWRMDTNSFRDVEGQFRLMSPEESAWYSGINSANSLPEAVRVIEDGSVRTVIEALFRYNESFLCMHYKLPKKGTEIQLEVRVNWSEKSRMLKLSIPTAFKESKYIGQTAFGAEVLAANGDEAVAQKWVTLVSENSEAALSIINDGIYGSDCCNGEIRLSLLRSPGYCAHPIMDRPIMPQDRFSPRIDQGERLFSFWINAGKKTERLESIDREALIHNEQPHALSFFPSGLGIKPSVALYLTDNAVQMTAFKKSESTENYVIRLFEPTGKSRNTRIIMPIAGIEKEVSLKGFEVKTFMYDTKTKTITESDLMEQ